MSAVKRLIRRAADFDGNEERRHLASIGRCHLAWSVQWLSIVFGVGVTHEPSGEPFGAWVHIGPFTVEFYIGGDL